MPVFDEGGVTAAVRYAGQILLLERVLAATVAEPADWIVRTEVEPLLLVVRERWIVVGAHTA
jgi:hypothetical protein